MNKLKSLPGLSLLIFFMGGCAYRGAVYSEYNQTALDIRAQQASSSPIKVNFGYDRGVFAYVPKRNAGSNSLDGEAVSVIAWNNLQENINPFKTTNTLLQVDAGFISGVAAVVASAPANSEVVIVPVHDAVFEPIAKTEERSSAGIGIQKVTTSGQPGARITTAVKTFAVSDSFLKDDAGDLLRAFWKPNGSNIDTDHNTLITSWMDSNGLDTNKVPVTMFLRGQLYKDFRKKAVKDLELENSK